MNTRCGLNRVYNDNTSIMNKYSYKVEINYRVGFSKVIIE